MRAEAILSKLTGGTVTDKSYLVDMITKYARREKDAEEVKKLGQKLYQILLDSGLNEKPEIDKDRLLEKADNYIYADRDKDAIEILKVLESQEDWEFKKDKYPVYYFNNEIEVKKFSYLNPNLTFLWRPSIKNEILTLLGHAEIKLKLFKQAKETLIFLRKINPVNINLFMLEAKFEKEKNLEKFKNILFDAFNYAYTQGQFASIYSELSYYYELKSDYETAYCLLRAATSFSNSLEIEIAQKKLHEKFKDLGLKLPKLTGEEVGNKLTALNIPIMITEEMFTAVSEGYTAYLESGYANPEGKDYFRAVLLSVTNDQNYVYNLEDMADVPKSSEEQVEEKPKQEEKERIVKAKPKNAFKAKNSAKKMRDSEKDKKSIIKGGKK